MKKSIAISIGVVWALLAFAQSNESAPMDFFIKKEKFPPMLSIVPNSVRFVDANNNNVIDANEICNFRFSISNDGRGDGYGCVARVNMTGTTKGIQTKDVNLPKLSKGEMYMVEIPILATADTETGELTLDVYVDEPNGFSTEHITSKIGTHKLKTPFVSVVSYKVVGASAGTLERRKPFNLQVIVQNIEQGEAQNVQVKLKLPQGVFRVGGSSEYLVLPFLTAGENKTLEYELITNQEASSKMDIQIALSEKHGKYAENATIPLEFGQHIGSSITMDIQRKDQEVEIKRASLVSAVDENIPETNAKNTNTFALIIANENYQSVAPVPYALNDGKIFRDYCVKTLGIPEKQIKYIPNATGNQIKAQIKWLQTLTEVFSDARVIFYYAGHGIPDESSRTAYLLPVDGIGTDVTTGYKLDDLYAVLGGMPAEKVTVFMDACFSGSKREEGMLDSVRGVGIKTKKGVPQGNMVVFSAAQSDETAYPNNDERHGMFTYFLLKKLQETKGDVTLHELGEYITTNVSQQSILLNGKSQTPCVTPSASLDASWREWKLR